MLALLMLGVAASCEAADAPTSRAELARALARTESKAGGHEVHGDTIFLIRQGTLLTGRHVELSLQQDALVARQLGLGAEYELWAARDHLLTRFPADVDTGGAAAFDAGEARGLETTDPTRFRRRFEWEGREVLGLMTRVLACRPGARLLPLLGAPGYEYVSTHQVLGLLLARDRGCISRAVLLRQGGRYLGRVAEEFRLEPDRFDDLQLERAAALAMAGWLDRVPDRFVSRVVAAQGADGLWHFDETVSRLGLMGPEHATALAYFVLSAAYAARP